MKRTTQLPFTYENVPTVCTVAPEMYVNGMDSYYNAQGAYVTQGAIFNTGGTVMEDVRSLSYPKGEYSNAVSMSNMGIQPMTYLNQGGFIDLDEEKLQTTLNNKIWDKNQKIKPNVKDKLLDIADQFKQSLNLYVTLDIRVTGSIANYNYNENSDLDLHLVFDFSTFPIEADFLQDFFKAKKDEFNSKYAITIYGIPVEVGVEDINTPLVSTGVYSLIEDDWLIKPSNSGQEYDDVDPDDYNSFIQEIDKVLETQDIHQIKSLMKMISTMRKTSLAQDGELGEGNLLFKKLRNDGYISKIKKALNNIISKELSLESVSLSEDELNTIKSISDTLFSQSAKNIVDGLMKATNNDEELAIKALNNYTKNNKDGLNKKAIDSAKQQLENKLEAKQLSVPDFAFSALYENDFAFEEKKKSKKDKEYKSKVKSDKKTGVSVSEDEDYIYDKLKEKYGKVERQYKDKERFPWMVDFYIPSEDMFLEYSKHWTHGRKKYNPDDEQCKDDVKWLKSKQDNEFYKRALTQWTEKDPEKFQTAEENGVNLVVWYNIREFEKWFENPELTYEEYKDPDSLQYDSDDYFYKKDILHQDTNGNDSDYLG